MLTRLVIQDCRAQDVAVLQAAAPFPGQTNLHAQRFERQQDGAVSYLIAWLDGAPVGNAEVRWEGCTEVAVRARFDGCPEIGALDVWPEAMRSRGVGSALLTAAEARIVGRELRWSGVGVALDNPRAADLYRRRGYGGLSARYVASWTYLDLEGVAVTQADDCEFLVKVLAG